MTIFGDCRPTKQDINKGTRKVVEAIRNNGAFKNPVENGKDAVNDILGTIPTNPGDPAEPFGTRLTAITTGLGVFNEHAKKLSGTGSLTEFSKIIGISGAFNDSRASMENSQQDNFSQMFQSVVEGPKQLSVLETLVGEVKQAALNNDPNLENLVVEAEEAMSNLTAMKNSDNTNFDQAMSYVVKEGLGKSVAAMVSPDGNCFAKTLIEEQIASDGMKGAIATFGMPSNIQDNLPDDSTINFDDITNGVVDTETAEQAEQRILDESIETRLSSLESDNIVTKSALSAHSITTTTQKLDGGSYGA